VKDDPNKHTHENSNDTNHSIGAIIHRDGKYLLLDRKNFPFGFACVAGHIKKNQTEEQALNEEVLEESCLKVISFKKVIEEYVDWNDCRRHKGHYYNVYEIHTAGEPRICEDEAKSMGWFTPKQMKTLKLEPVWEYFFRKLGVLK